MMESWTRGYLVGMDDKAIWRNQCSGDCRSMNCWLVRFDLPISIKLLEIKDEPVIRFVPFDEGSDKKGLMISNEDKEFYADLMSDASKKSPKRFNISYCYADQC